MTENEEKDIAELLSDEGDILTEDETVEDIDETKEGEGTGSDETDGTDFWGCTSICRLEVC